MKHNFNIKNIKAIIGLGNPDDKYKDTYHNIGILFIDYLKDKNEIAPKLIPSENYMNNSGQFVEKTLNYYKILPKQILVAHDDSDLTIGNYKLSFDRGSAGHKGINSIIKHLQTKEFWRLRIGIRPEEYKGKAENFVLNKISEKHKSKINKTFEEIGEEIIS